MVTTSWRTHDAFRFPTVASEPPHYPPQGLGHAPSMPRRFLCVPLPTDAGLRRLSCRIARAALGRSCAASKHTHTRLRHFLPRAARRGFRLCGSIADRAGLRVPAATRAGSVNTQSFPRLGQRVAIAALSMLRRRRQQCHEPARRAAAPMYDLVHRSHPLHNRACTHPMHQRIDLHRRRARVLP